LLFKYIRSYPLYLVTSNQIGQNLTVISIRRFNRNSFIWSNVSTWVLTEGPVRAKLIFMKPQKSYSTACRRVLIQLILLIFTVLRILSQYPLLLLFVTVLE
jgi:hypothetical protein